MTPNNIVDGYGHFEGMWRHPSHRREVYLRYITLEPVTLQSKRTLFYKLIIIICLVCWYAVLGTLI